MRGQTRDRPLDRCGSPPLHSRAREGGSGYESAVPGAWPIEEIWGRPLGTLVLAACLPFLTARALAALTLPARLPADPAAAARAVAPFRAGATIVGLVQIQVAWTLGATALGPGLVARPDGLASGLFGALAAAITFALGAPARAIESAGTRAPLEARPAARPSVLAVVGLRLRVLPWVGGPVLAATAASTMPVVRDGEVRPAWVLAAVMATFLGVAYAGPALSVVTLALRPASAEVAALARRAAANEGIGRIGVLRLPTHGVRLANAAALPWARTMIVTDHIVSLLGERELEAVLAHEAAHLSEAPWVSMARLGVVSILLFASTTGSVIADAVSPGSSAVLLAAVLVAALPLVMLLLRLARRMEERADAHARERVSSDALADALVALATDARAPLVTGRKHARLHPDLYDRICACGRDPGPRPEPPARRPGLVAGLVIGAGLVALPTLSEAATRIEPGSEAFLGSSAASWRLRVDPWDPQATLALGWASALGDDPALARTRLAAARTLGADEADALELEAQLAAAAGECGEARARFDDALRERARERFEEGRWEPLELGGYHLPPALVTECGYGE